MQDIQKGKLDEDGLGINNVESSLARVDIKLRSSQGTFREFDDVIEELAKKWNTLNDVEQANIAKSIAGVRQANVFRVLMQDMTQAQSLYKEQLEQTGIAQKNYAVYLENIEAAQNKLTASWEGFWQSQEMTESISFVYNGLASILDVLTKYGPMLYNMQKWFMPVLASLESMKYSLNTVKESLLSIGKMKNPFSDMGTLGDTAAGIVNRIQGRDPKKESSTKAYDDMEIARMKQWQKSIESVKGSVQDLGEEWNPVAEKSQKAFDTILEMTIKMLKLQKEKAKENVKEYIDYLKKQMEAQKESYKAAYEYEKRMREESKNTLKQNLEDLKYKLDMKKRAAKEEYDEIMRIRDAEKESLKNSLDAYDRIIDKQIESLRRKKEDVNFQREMEDKQEEMANLQAKILELSFDDSAEAQAELLRLKEKAKELQEQIDEDIADNEIDQQIRVLEDSKKAAQEEYELKMKAIRESEEAAKREYDLKMASLEQEESIAERRYELKLREFEEAQKFSDLQYEQNIKNLELEYEKKESLLQEQIKSIESYLSQEGLIRRNAMNILATDSEKTYKKLVEWNKYYGDGLTKTVVDTWKSAEEALKSYIQTLNSIPNRPVSIIGGGGRDDEIPDRHSGLSAGAVGLKGNEEIIKVLKGEVIMNQSDIDKFMNRVLPSMLNIPKVENIGQSGDIKIEMPVVVQGNLDQTVLPKMEIIFKEVVNRLNSSVLNRGVVRQTSMSPI